MEVARSPVAIPRTTEAAQVAPPGARDAADGFSQVSTRDLKPSAATPAASAAPQTTVAEPAAPPVETGQAKPPAPAANGSTAPGSPADSEGARGELKLSPGNGSHSSQSSVFDQTR